MNNNEVIVKEKNSKGLVIIVVLILIIISLIGFIVYEKLIIKDTTSNNTNTSNVTNQSKNETTSEVKENNKEYISFDSKQYLKLNSDNTYELSGYFMLSNETINKKGSYSKNNNDYILDDSLNVINRGDFIEIQNIVSDEYSKTNAILFDKSKVNEIEEKIKTNYKSNLTERFDGYRKNNSNLANIEKIDINLSDCFNYSFNGEEVKQDGSFRCSSTYDLYLTGYSKAECENETHNITRENANSVKYYDYLVSSGQCMDNTVRNGGFATINYNDSYKVGCCASGL